MKTYTKIIVAIIAVICLAFIFLPKIYKPGIEEEQAPATSTEDAKLHVSAVIVQNTEIDNDLRVTGSLLANESVTLSTEVSGVVEQIYFKEGQRVKQGQLLIQLNDDEFKAEIEKLQFTQKLNEDIEYRQKQLLAKEAISKEEYETALTTLNTSIAEIKVKQVQIQKHKIVAPFDGVIGLRSVSKGSYLNPADPIATLYSINPIKLDFSVPGKYTADVNTGDPISFTVDGYEERFHGKIYAIEPQIDPKTRSIKTRALCDNKENKLLPGQFAKIALTLATFDKALMIPTEAVVPEMDGKKVFVLEKGKVANRKIETGIRTSTQIQVTEGLNQGDTVITTGLLQIGPGMDVDLNVVTQ